MSKKTAFSIKYNYIMEDQSDFIEFMNKIRYTNPDLQQDLNDALEDEKRRCNSVIVKKNYSLLREVEIVEEFFS